MKRALVVAPAVALLALSSAASAREEEYLRTGLSQYALGMLGTFTNHSTMGRMGGGGASARLEVSFLDQIVTVSSRMKTPVHLGDFVLVEGALGAMGGRPETNAFWGQFRAGFGVQASFDFGRWAGVGARWYYFGNIDRARPAVAHDDFSAVRLIGRVDRWIGEVGWDVPWSLPKSKFNHRPEGGSWFTLQLRWLVPNEFQFVGLTYERFRVDLSGDDGPEIETSSSLQAVFGYVL